MKKVNSYFLRSIKDILRWDVLKLALGIGLPLMALWIAVGWVYWDLAVSVTSKIISWVPFSIVKANGALFILFFIWFVAVLVSFAIITALIGPPILRKFKEKTYYFYTFATLLILSAGWALLLLLNWHVVNEQIQKLLTLLPFQTVADGIAWLIAFYLFYNLFILSLYLVISYFRRPFLDAIKEIDYPHIDTAGSGISKKHHISVLRDSALFILFSIALFPILFIPVANVIAQLFLWAWLYRESYFLSTCSLYCNEEDYRQLCDHRYTIWSIAIFAALLNFLPVINIFAPFFAQLMFFHWIMEHKSSLAGYTVAAAPKD
ncbi:MAG: EI24 domain-containing protein [Hydrogenimonas sp.]|nr:EI24 domain-containing protein [Hydrogenimonas sp.]